MVSEGQESRHSLAGCLWLKVSHEVSVKLLGGAAVSSEDSNGCGPTLKFTYVVGRPSPGGLPTGLPHSIVAPFPR